MDYAEKDIRCGAAIVGRSIRSDGRGCRVYARYVRDCGDCSFSFITRENRL